MKYDEYTALISECKNIKTKEQFVLEYGCPPAENLSVEGLLKKLHIIYSVSKNDFSELLKSQELKITYISQKFNIPYRTVQDWNAKVRKIPSYILEMIGFVLISEIESKYYEID